MLNKFDTRDFGAFLINFERACTYTELILTPPPVGDPDGLLRQAIPQYRQALLGLMKTCLDGKVLLSQSVGLQIGRLEHRLSNERDFHHPSLVAEARVTRQLLLDDLAQHAFVTIPRDFRQFYEQSEPLFGQEVADEFQDANRDIEGAGRCLALSEWTACVFHCMRVLEHGLGKMAGRFSVPFGVDSWHAVLRGIEDGITILRNQRSLTEEMRAEITYYSDIASQFRHFKDAWRNHVSHAREHYDDRVAMKVYTAVRDVMQQLAKPVLSGP
jgi:hypothetical protein